MQGIYTVTNFMEMEKEAFNKIVNQKTEASSALLLAH